MTTHPLFSYIQPTGMRPRAPCSCVLLA